MASASATMAPAMKSRCPSEIARQMAERSAQMVEPLAAFSTLAPSITAPLPVSSAAPTGKWELRA